MNQFYITASRTQIAAWHFTSCQTKHQFGRKTTKVHHNHGNQIKIFTISLLAEFREGETRFWFWILCVSVSIPYVSSINTSSSEVKAAMCVPSTQASVLLCWTGPWGKITSLSIESYSTNITEIPWSILKYKIWEGGGWFYCNTTTNFQITE